RAPCPRFRQQTFLRTAPGHGSCARSTSDHPRPTRETDREPDRARTHSVPQRGGTRGRHRHRTPDRLMSETVLVMASVDDGEADRVLNELHRRGHKAVLLDLSWFPQHARIVGQLGASGWEGHLATPYTPISFENIRAVYHRRCSPFEPASTMNEHERRFATPESRLALAGILASLP